MLYFPNRDVAAKTGTTNDKRDAWIIGYAPNIAVGAWAGNNDNRSMNELSGLIVAPMWRAFMDIALEKLPEEFFGDAPATPLDIKPVLRGIWFDPGAVIADPEDEDEDTPTVSLMSTIASAHDILHFVKKDDPRGPYPQNPQNDPQYVLWEYPVSLWKSAIIGLSEKTSEKEKSENTEEDAERRDDDRNN
jgi:membrane peptidoglycan carboxypeptidase